MPSEGFKNGSTEFASPIFKTHSFMDWALPGFWPALIPSSPTLESLALPMFPLSGHGIFSRSTAVINFLSFSGPFTKLF